MTHFLHIILLFYAYPFILVLPNLQSAFFFYLSKLDDLYNLQNILCSQEMSIKIKIGRFFITN